MRCLHLAHTHKRTDVACRPCSESTELAVPVSKTRELSDVCCKYTQLGVACCRFTRCSSRVCKLCCGEKYLANCAGQWSPKRVTHQALDPPQPMSSSLKAFILRNEVITLYRNFCKAVRQAPDHTKGTCIIASRACFSPPRTWNRCLKELHHPGDLKEQVRGGFELNRGVQDLYAVKYHLSDGRVQLKMLREMMAMKL